MSAVGVVLVADGRSAMSDDDADRAVDRAVALLRCARQHRAKRSLREAFFSMWFLTSASREIQAIVDVVELDEQQIERVLEELEWTKEHDPFGYRAAIAQEPHDKVARLHAERDAAVLKRREAEDQNGFVDKQDQIRARRLVDTRVNALEKWIIDSYQAAARLWDDPDAETKLGELDWEVEQSEFLNLIILPSFQMHWQNEHSGLKHAQLARTALTESRKD